MMKGRLSYEGMQYLWLLPDDGLRTRFFPTCEQLADGWRDYWLRYDSYKLEICQLVNRRFAAITSREFFSRGETGGRQARKVVSCKLSQQLNNFYNKAIITYKEKSESIYMYK